jgi:hypothetical protein
MARKVDTVARYFRRLASFAGNRFDYDGILHPEFQVVEYPSLQNPTLRTTGLDERVQRVGEGRKRYSAQHFEVTNQLESELQVAIEGNWSGLLAVDVGPNKKGKSLKGKFCMVFEFKEEQIYRQRSYETVDPSAT